MEKERDDKMRDAASGDGSEGSRDGSRADGAVTDDTSQVASEDVEALQDEVRALTTKWMRALADLDNYKKRVQRERGRWISEARAEILLSLLEVVDDFERAVACGDDSGLPADDPFRGGVELILERLRGVLSEYGVEAIDTCGTGFDPAVHEAVAHVESDEHESDQIVEELRRGYMLGDRLLRCSRVVVAK